MIQALGGENRQRGGPATETAARQAQPRHDHLLVRPLGNQAALRRLQRPPSPTPSPRLAIGAPADGAEHEAEAAAAAVMQRRPVPPLSAQPPRLSRWKITGSTATADSDQDRLGLLPDKVKSKPENWVCIQPISMRTAAAAPPPADFQAHYERYVQIGDSFDLSNLTAAGGSNRLRLSLFLDPEVQAALSGPAFYPGMTGVTKDPVTDMATRSGEGRTPLSDFVAIGHSGGHSLYGDGGTITPKDLKPDLPDPSFDRARAGRLPHRCWFTTDAQARAIGCQSETFGDEFAATFLRTGGSTIHSTLRDVTLPFAPGYTPGQPKPDGQAKYSRSILFNRNPDDPTDPAQVGPFTDAESFHASKFWQKSKGWL